MASNSNGINRRLAFLEKAYLQDRKRWAAAERMFEGLWASVRRQGDELKRQGDELKRQGDLTQKLTERLEAVTRILLRKLEN
jgi:hypothetical protein